MVKLAPLQTFIFMKKFDKELNILVIPSWYPTVSSPHSGSFFLEQSLSLEKYGANVVVGFCDLIGKRQFLKKICNIYPHTTIKIEKGLKTYRLNGIDYFDRGTKKGHEYWVFKLQSLIKMILKKERIDIIHCHSFSAAIAVSRIEEVNIPYVITEHASKFFN